MRKKLKIRQNDKTKHSNAIKPKTFLKLKQNLPTGLRLILVQQRIFAKKSF